MKKVFLISGIVTALVLTILLFAFLPFRGKQYGVWEQDGMRLELSSVFAFPGRESALLSLSKDGEELSRLLLDADAVGLSSRMELHWLSGSVMLVIHDAEEATFIMGYDGSAGPIDDALFQGQEPSALNGNFSPGISIGDFMERYSLVCESYGCDGLYLASQSGGEICPSLLDGRSVLRYAFKSDPGNGLEPELALYEGPDSSLVELVAIGFENHGYTQWGTDLSRERSFFALKALLGPVGDSAIWEMVDNIYPHIQRSENFTEHGSIPAKENIYIHGPLALFSYFSGGISWLCICSAEALAME